MSKIRIYELAKELGVDNKVVIARATELGLTGKISHSNSLEAEEADQIRRAVIRQAIGSPRAQEVVTTRVDSKTGQTEAVVERRQGNVIRRRKQTSSEEEGSEATAESTEAASAPEQVDAPLGGSMNPDDLFTSPPVQHADTSADEAEEVVAEEPEADAGYHAEHGTNGSAAVESIEEASEVESVEAASTDEADVAEPEAAATAVAAKAAPAPGVTPPGVAAPAAAPRSAALSNIPPSQAQFQPTTKAAVGPKILGKIELPVKKVPVKVEPPKRPFAAGGAVAPTTETPEEEDADRKRAAAKKKGRKREVTSFDLADHGGRDGRRGGRAVPSRGGSRYEPMKRESQQPLEVAKMKASKRVVKMDEVITVGELAKQLSVKAGEVISKLLELGVMATINQVLDKETATIVAEEFEYQIESTGFDESVILDDVKEEDSGNRRPRPPIVTVMGHVDHGKTSLLDAIRSTSVAAREHGGITQHIGAYSVKVDDTRSVTFIDTPGHEAFTAMRARGAQVTDIVILVVAADDGVMPQTREAINHAQAAKVPIIVAINKIDKPDGNPDRIKSQLAELGLQPEDWGGDTMFFPVSALKATGLTELLEGTLLVAEMKELGANRDSRARGTVIEAKQDRGRGSVATIIVQSGTLKVGEVFVCGADFGRVRSMGDYTGSKLEEATPSTAIEVTGFNSLPMAGDDFFVVESEAQARQVATSRYEKKKAKEERSLLTGPISLEDFARRANNMAALELNIILKADVQGSVEAAKASIERLSGDKVKVRVLHSAVGGVNESDVQLAIASSALIVGFGVRAEPRAMADAERAGVEIRFYRVIYEVVDDVKSAMVGLLPPLKEEFGTGRVEVREIFNVPKIGTIAGCYVTSGTVKRGSHSRLLRDSRVIHEGRIGTLRRFKDDVREVSSGYECGITLDNYNDIKLGDVLEVFDYKEVAPTLE